MERQVRELDTKLAQLSLASASHSDKLIELCHNHNQLKEALTEQYGEASRQTLDRLDQTEAEVKALVAYEKTIAKRVGELHAKLVQLSLESASQSDKLIELCHNNNHLKEALTEQLQKASILTLDRLKRNEAEMKNLLSSETTMGQRIGELNTRLVQLSVATDSQNDKLIEVRRNNNDLKETLTELLGQVSDRNAAEIKVLYCEKSESLMSAINSTLTSVPSDRKTDQQVITGYAALKEQALKDGWSRSLGEKVYIRGYLMSWEISFWKEGDSVNLALCIQLHDGRQDEFLDWPFTKELKLSIIHPETRQERLLRDTGYSSEDNKKLFSRPVGGSNTPTRLPETKVDSSEIERDGYVKGDQLLVRLEVSL